MKKMIIIFLMLSVFLSVYSTQDDNETINNSDGLEQKIDDIYVLQKKMYEENKKDALKDKKYGIELNLINLLLVDEFKRISGTFSLFAVDRKAEIAFPFYITFPKEEYHYDAVTLDCHYRYFLGNTQNGFYLSGLSRLAFISGKDYYSSTSNKKKVGKFGIGFGIGYRYFSYNGFYWGASLSIGRFIIGPDIFDNNLNYTNDNQAFIDFEFLKFGYSF